MKRWEYDSSRSDTVWMKGGCYFYAPQYGLVQYGGAVFDDYRFFQDCKKVYDQSNGGAIFVFKVMYEQNLPSGETRYDTYSTYTYSLPGGGFRNWYNPNSGNVWASPITQTFNYAK